MDKHLLTPAVALTLAACGGGTSEPVAPRTPEPPSAFQNQVAELSTGERNGVFIRAIRDAGKDCQGVVESHLAPQPWNGGPLWIARCTDGKHYGVALGRDGTAQIVSRP